MLCGCRSFHVKSWKESRLTSILANGSLFLQQIVWSQSKLKFKMGTQLANCGSAPLQVRTQHFKQMVRAPPPPRQECIYIHFDCQILLVNTFQSLL